MNVISDSKPLRRFGSGSLAWVSKAQGGSRAIRLALCSDVFSSGMGAAFLLGLKETGTAALEERLLEKGKTAGTGSVGSVT